MEVYNINFNDVIQSLFDKIGALENGAAGAMPITGGIFTGNVKAYGDNREGSCLRNIIVKDAADSSTISTNLIKMVRK